MSVVKIVPAKFDTECEDCPDPIVKGDLVTHSEEGWAHDECPSFKMDKSKLCMSCFTLKSISGDCACIWED